ncbi:MAG: TolC family protein, partial [Candidatus Omnitrophica bacterium]|nr:TolC family protein [Candidatus Omnitrophota bacterium]
MEVKIYNWMPAALFAAVLVCAAENQAVADTAFPGEKTISLDAVIEDAAKSNPEILAAKRGFEAANARIPQAASLSDPEIGFEYDRITADRELSGNPMKTVSVSQDIPFPTKLYLRAKIASKLAKMAYENYKAKEREIISRVKSAYAELFITYKTIEIGEENKNVLEQLYKTAEAKYSSGTAPERNALRARFELARVENELILLEQKRLTAQARLNVLLNKDPREKIGIPESAPMIKFNRTLDDLSHTALEGNPELKAYR